MNIGVIVARLQIDELHSGHRSLIDRVKEVSDATVILLGISRARGTEKNPLDFETRKVMIQEEYPTINVIPVYDNKSDEVWSKNLDEIIESLIPNPQAFQVTLHHSRDSFVSHYHGSCPSKEWEAILEDNGTKRRAEIGVMKPEPHPAFRRGIIYNAFNRYPIIVPAVDMFVYNHKTGEVLLGRRKGMTEWRLPGGMVDGKDKGYRFTAVRELQEETGLVISPKAFEALDSFQIEDWGYPSTGKDRIFSTLFWVDYDGDQIAKGADDIEEVKWFPIEEVAGAWTDYPLVITDEHKPLIHAAIQHYRELKLDAVQ